MTLSSNGETMNTSPFLVATVRIWECLPEPSLFTGFTDSIEHLHRQMHTLRDMACSNSVKIPQSSLFHVL